MGFYGADGGLLLRRENTNKSVQIDVNATGTGATGVISPRAVGYTVYVQRIIFHPTTYATGTFVFLDGGSGTVKIGEFAIPATIPTTGGETNQHVLDYGPEGVPLTAGKRLDYTNTAGPAGKLQIFAYERPTDGAVYAAAGAANQ